MGSGRPLQCARQQPPGLIAVGRPSTVKEGFIGRHLTFVPLGGVQVGPDVLQVQVTKERVRTAPDIEMHGEELSQADESTLYHHFEMNYTPIKTESGRRLARR